MRRFTYRTLFTTEQPITLEAVKNLFRFDVIIIDDFGYVQQGREEMEVLFTLMNYRYERGSIMITSNLPFSKWEVIFKDPMTTATAINRLVHHSVILETKIVDVSHIPPKYAVSEVVGKVKGITSSRLRKKFAWLGRVYWKENVVWSPGYFVSTVGVDEDKILKYVAWQQTQDLGQAKLDL